MILPRSYLGGNAALARERAFMELLGPRKNLPWFCGLAPSTGFVFYCSRVGVDVKLSFGMRTNRQVGFLVGEAPFIGACWSRMQPLCELCPCHKLFMWK